jgi:hypothetical protein
VQGFWNAVKIFLWGESQTEGAEGGFVLWEKSGGNFYGLEIWE